MTALLAKLPPAPLDALGVDHVAALIVVFAFVVLMLVLVRWAAIVSRTNWKKRR